MAELRTTRLKREILQWSPYVRLVHDYPEVGRYGTREIKSRSINDHALHYFFQGIGEYEIDGNTYRIEPGAVFIVRPGHGYCFTLEPEPQPYMLNIHFDLIEQPDSFYPHPYPDAARHHAPLALPDEFTNKVSLLNRKNYENTFFELYSIFLLQGIKWELKKKSLLLDLLGIIYDNVTPSIPGILPEHRIVVQRALEFIHNNLNRKISLDDLIKNANVCRALFIRIFKAECGLTPAKFIYKVKIEKARNELISGLPIKQVAENLGFADVYHFSRIFKEFTGMPPGQFKKTLLD